MPLKSLPRAKLSVLWGGILLCFPITSYAFAKLFKREVPPPKPAFVWPEGSCGTSGNIEERILGCNQRYYAKKKGTIDQVAWALVARYGTQPALFRDPEKENLWTGVLSKPMNLNDAKEACRNPDLEIQMKGGVELAATLTWSLPEITEYEKAALSGMNEALPDIRTSAWSFDWFVTMTEAPPHLLTSTESDLGGDFMAVHRITGKSAIRDASDSTLSLVRCLSRPPESTESKP